MQAGLGTEGNGGGVELLFRWEEINGRFEWRPVGSMTPSRYSSGEQGGRDDHSVGMVGGGGESDE
jgi:hypothetical protein